MQVSPALHRPAIDLNSESHYQFWRSNVAITRSREKNEEALSKLLDFTVGSWYEDCHYLVKYETEAEVRLLLRYLSELS